MRLGVAGLGTVAQGLFVLLSENADRVARQLGQPISVARVASRTPRSHIDTLGAEFSTELNSLLQDDVDIVVELIGGTDDANRLISRAIELGKPVVTANKAVLSQFGNSYISRARESHVPLGFEASVAGGIPIVAVLKDGLAGNSIDSITGILNGTCNFVLTQMDAHDSTFESALRQAQDLGFAESDPSFDIDGIDAAQKLSILGSIAFDQPIDLANIYIEGITNIQLDDLHYARELGYRIKHIAVARVFDSSVEMRVHPALVSDKDLMSRIDGVDNAISVAANGVGSLLLKGPGAGSRPTASAVLSDIIEIAKGKSSLPTNTTSTRRASPICDLTSSYYLYVPVSDEPGVMATLAEVLGNHRISMESVIQKSDAIQQTGNVRWVPVVLLTDEVRESVLDETIRDLQELSAVHGDIRRVRVVNLN
ncbi:MAG: homoserine dehydrogenase [Gammaproteobacteria bacterium]|nr:homoserine dehydrogenase [Gammaproteobacteria bacterium]